MTIEQRQNDAENWAYAYADWLAADEQAHHYDELRVAAETRLAAARARLSANAMIGPKVLTRVYMLPPTNSNQRDLVKVTYDVNCGDYLRVELLRTEPSE